MLDRRWDEARQSFDKAFQLNPNDASLIMSNALATAWLGDHEAAASLSSRAMQTNPFTPDYYLGYDAMIAFLAGRYADCVAICRGMEEISPIDLGVWYAAACHYLGETSKAKEVAANFLEQVAACWAGEEESSPENIMQWFGTITVLRQEADLHKLYLGAEAAGLPCQIESGSES
jgi:tetratricopeptide (TPR) repeat protein